MKFIQFLSVLLACLVTASVWSAQPSEPEARESNRGRSEFVALAKRVLAARIEGSRRSVASGEGQCSCVLCCVGKKRRYGAGAY